MRFRVLLCAAVVAVASGAWAQQTVQFAQSPVTDRVQAQKPLPPDAAQIQKPLPPPSEMEVLRSRIQALEREVAALKQRPAGTRAVTLTPPNERIRHDLKADDNASLASSIDSLWKAVDQLWKELEKINRPR